MPEMKTCNAPNHVGERVLPIGDFYYDKANKRHLARCKHCHVVGTTAHKKRTAKKVWASAPTVMPPVAQAEPEQSNPTPLEQLPLGHYVKGISTFVNKEGEIIGQWIKTQVEQQDRAALLLAALAKTAAELPRAEAVEITATMLASQDEDLLCVVPVGDPHLGMLAWAPETGEHFDMSICERQLYAAADHLIRIAPPAKRGLLVNAGDFFHVDNAGGTTFGGTPQDTDGRYTKMYEAGIRLMRRLIARMLEKFEHVTVINEIGNHDTSTAQLLSICLANIYENDPRVTIDTSPEPFHYYRFGKVLIGTHHGDKTKRDDLQRVMSCDRARDWGETVHRHWYIGHVHHDTVKELGGCTVESLRTLASKDKWHHGQGYRSGRDLKLDVWHREWGYQGRQVVDISLVKVLSEDFN
jgi:hypothetical protein